MDKRKRKKGSISRPATNLVLGKEVLKQPIEILRLSRRSRIRLKKARIVSIGQLMRRDDSQILSIPKLGPKSLSEIRNNLLCYLRLQLKGGDYSQNGSARDPFILSHSLPVSKFQSGTPTLSEVSEGLLNLLNQRQREVITLRYGLDDPPRLTLNQIGKRLGVTRERVRQIQDEALGVLRSTHSSSSPRPLTALVYQILKSRKGLGYMDVVLKEVLKTFSSGAAAGGNKDPRVILSFILTTDEKIQKRDRDIWGFKEYPAHLARIIGSHYLRILGRHGKLTAEEIIEEFSRTALYQRHEQLLSRDFLFACLKIQRGIIPQGNNLYGLNTRGLTCSGFLTLLLRRAGRPMHYRELGWEVRKLTRQGVKPYSLGYMHNILVEEKQFQRVRQGIYRLVD